MTSAVATAPLPAPSKLLLFGGGLRAEDWSALKKENVLETEIVHIEPDPVVLEISGKASH